MSRDTLPSERRMARAGRWGAAGDRQQPMHQAQMKKRPPTGRPLIVVDSNFGHALTVVMPMMMPPMTLMGISRVHGMSHDNGGEDGSDDNSGDRQAAMGSTRGRGRNSAGRNRRCRHQRKERFSH